MSRRRKKEVSEEEIIEMEEFLNRNNIEEEKLFQTISINVKCKSPNQKKLVNSIKQKLRYVVNEQKEKIEIYYEKDTKLYEKIKENKL